MNNRNNQIKCLKAMKEIDYILTENNIWYCLSYGSALGAFREQGFIEWDRDIDILIKVTDQYRVNSLLKKYLSTDYKLISYLDDTTGGYDEVDIVGISANNIHIDIYPIIAGPNDLENAYRYLRYCRLMHKLLGCKKFDSNRLKYKWKIPFVIIIRMIEKLVPDKFLRKYIHMLENRYDFASAKYYFPFSNDGKKGEIMEAELLFNTKRIRFESSYFPVPCHTEEYLRKIYGNDFMTPMRY